MRAFDPQAVDARGSCYLSIRYLFSSPRVLWMCRSKPPDIEGERVKGMREREGERTREKERGRDKRMRSGGSLESGEDL